MLNMDPMGKTEAWVYLCDNARTRPTEKGHRTSVVRVGDACQPRDHASLVSEPSLFYSRA